MNEICSICLLDITKDKITTICCNNSFHEKCYSDWMKINPTCPLCRKLFIVEQRVIDIDIERTLVNNFKILYCKIIIILFIIVFSLFLSNKYLIPYN
jgi:hypothetical protein